MRKNLKEGESVSVTSPHLGPAGHSHRHVFDAPFGRRRVGHRNELDDCCAPNTCRWAKEPPTAEKGRTATVADGQVVAGCVGRGDFCTNCGSDFSLTWHSFHFQWHATIRRAILQRHAHKERVYRTTANVTFRAKTRHKTTKNGMKRRVYGATGRERLSDHRAAIILSAQCVDRATVTHVYRSPSWARQTLAGKAIQSE